MRYETKEMELKIYINSPCTRCLPCSLLIVVGGMLQLLVREEVLQFTLEYQRFIWRTQRRSVENERVWKAFRRANVKDFHSERNVIVLLFVSRNINRKRGWHDRYFRERIGRSGEHWIPISFRRLFNSYYLVD